MKTAIITDEITQDLRLAAKVAAEYGLDGIELRTLWDKAFHELSTAEITQVQSICAQYGLEVCAISSPFFKCDLTKEEIASQIELLKRCIHNAKKLNCGLIRCFSFWRSGPFEEQVARIAQAFSLPAEMAQKAGMVLAMEPDPAVNGCNGEQVARLVQQIHHPAVRVLWDPGNDVYAPIPERPFPDGYMYVKPYISHVHVKDAVFVGSKPESVKIGTGEVGWPAQLATLKKSGYTGYLSLEPHYRKGSEISEALMLRPGGADFSANGMEAGIECIEALQAMLKML